MSELARQADRQAADGRSTAEQAQQKVQEKAEELRGQVSSRVREQVDTRSTQAGDQLGSLADALRRTGRTLRDEGNDAPAKVTDAVAERIERLGSYLRESNADAILRDVEGSARRRPWFFAAGGLIAGMMASRFLKASSGGRYRSINDGARVSEEPEVVFEPHTELEAPAGVGHGA